MYILMKRKIELKDSCDKYKQLTKKVNKYYIISNSKY